MTEREQPDFRCVHRPDGWHVDAWAGNGWEALPGVHPTKRAAIESTRPPRGFCDRHWSWLCEHAQDVSA